MTQSPTILYIEDDAASRQLIHRMLTHAGYGVLLAATGLEGVDIARRDLPDLVLTDINLPDLSGFEVTTALRADPRFRETPIVALTAQGQAAQATAMAAGITGFLTKPIDIEKFIDQLNYYIQGGKDAISEDTLHDAQIKYTREVVSRLERRIRDLESANDALKKLDKMKETFIQITAHELRTPLTLIHGYSRLLEDNEQIKQFIAGDEGLLSLFSGLGDAVERMQTMIEEVLTMSRVMTNRIDLSVSLVNLGDVVQFAIDQFTHAIHEREMTIVFDKSQWPRKMQADGQLLRLVLMNLVSNAVKYTPDRGTISFHATTTETHVQFSVLDTGIGIAPHDQQKIFEQFHTLSDAKLHSTSKTAFLGGGLGLGLPIARGIIEAHGGEMWVESEGYDPKICPGSRFVVLMPLHVQRKQPVIRFSAVS